MTQKDRAEIARARVKRWQRSNPSKDLTQAPGHLKAKSREKRVGR